MLFGTNGWDGLLHLVPIPLRISIRLEVKKEKAAAALKECMRTRGPFDI